MMVSWAQLPALPERLLIAGNALWYYLASVLAPFGLAPIAPKWAVGVTDPKWWAGPIASVIAAVVVARWYARLGDLLLWGGAEFFTALAPVIGLVPFTYQHYTYVAMRFLYLSCIGGGVVLAVLADRLAGSGWTRRRYAVAAVGFGVLAVYGVLTRREAEHWRTNLGFWSYAVTRNPDSYPPNINLGLHYESTKHWPDALRYYQRAYELRPMDTYALTQYLRALSVVRGPQAVIDASDTELRRSNVNAFVAYFYRAMGYEQLGRRDEAVRDYDRVLGLTRQGSSTWKAAQQGRERLAHTPRP
jgi:tetratricopeptide (TPR) repeat protein